MAAWKSAPGKGAGAIGAGPKGKGGFGRLPAMVGATGMVGDGSTKGRALILTALPQPMVIL